MHVPRSRVCPRDLRLTSPINGKAMSRTDFMSKSIALGRFGQSKYCVLFIDLMLYAHSIQQRSCLDGQVLNQTFPGQAFLSFYRY